MIISDATSSTTKDTGSLVVEGGIGVEENLNVGGNAVITGNLTVSGTTTTVNSATLDVTDANITVNNGGNQAAADDIAGITVEMSDATDAKIIYDKDATSRFRIGDAASEVEIATISGAQVITNKDIDGGTASNSNRITVPKADKSTLDGLTRKEGTIVYAQDQNKLYADDGSALQPIGSGVGSVSIYGLLDGEDGDVSTWTNDGTATVAINSTTPLADDKDYKVTVTGTTQWVRTPAQSLDPRSQYANQTHSIKAQFKITGTAGAEWLVRALDNSNAAISEDLVLQYTDGNPSSFELMFNVASTVTSVKLEIECNSFTAGDLFYIDDIAFDDDPLNQKTMVLTQQLRHSAAASTMLNVADELEFNTSNITSTGDNIITVEDDSGNTRTKFIANMDCVLDVTCEGYLTTSGNRFSIFLNGAFYLRGTPTYTTDIGTVVTGSLKLSRGDYVTIHNTGSTTSAVSINFSMVARADADHVVREGADRLSEWESWTPSATGFGTISAAEGFWRRVGDTMEVKGSFVSGTSTAVDASIELPSGYLLDLAKLNSGQRGRLGIGHRLNGSNAVFTTADYTFSFFSDATDTDSIFFGSRSATDTTLDKENGSVLAASGDTIVFEFSVPIQGWTAGMPELYALPEGDVNNFSARIANNGTASITDKNADFIESVSRTSQGVVVVTWKSGFFTSAPSVVASATVNDRAASVRLPTTTSVTIWTGNPDVSSTDSDFTIHVARQGSDVRAQQVFLGNVSPTRIMRVLHKEASGVNAGTFTSGSYQTRPLTDLEGDIFGTLDTGTDRFTLPSGVYKVNATATAHAVDGHKLRLQNITDATTAILGTACYTSSVSGANVDLAHLEGRITLTSSKTFELQHRCTTTKTANGLGVGPSYGDENIFVVIEIEKLA